MQSPETLRKWLNALPWESRVWTCGARILTQAKNFNSMEEPFKTEMLKEINTFLLSKQNANGMFGSQEDNWYSILSGSYKIVSFMNSVGLSIPNIEPMRETVLRYLKTKKYNNLIVLYNTGNILDLIQQSSTPFTEQQRVEIIELFINNLNLLHAPDGGFLTNIDSNSHRAHGFILAEDVVEGDTNATSLAHKLRMILHAFANNEERKDVKHPNSFILVDYLNAVSK